MYDTKQGNYLNVFFDESSLKNKSFVVQQGDYNSNEVVCNLYNTDESGKTSQMDLTGMTVTVIFKHGSSRPTPEYTTDIDETHVGRIKFCIPQRIISRAGNAVQQIRIYGNDSLINSVVIPFEILDSIVDCGHDDGCKPITLSVLQKVDAALDDLAAMREEFAEAEAARQERFEKWEETFSNIESADQEIINMPTRYDFPSVGDVKKIYKAQQEKKLYQWNDTEQKYEPLEAGSIEDITVIHGGDADGIA